MPINIATQVSPSASAGKGGAGASGRITSEDFGSLFATLLGLTAPSTDAANPDSGASGAQQGNDPALNGPTGYPAIDAALAALENAQATGEGQAPAGAQATGPAETRSPDELLSNLIDVLDKLADSVDSGQDPGQDLIDQIASAINALNALIDPQAATDPANTPLLVSTGGVDAPGRDKGAQQSAGTSQGELSKELTDLVRKMSASTPDAASKLSEIAQKLEGTLPELATGLESLSRKFADSLQQGTATASHADPAAQSASDAGDTVGLLLANRQAAPKTDRQPANVDSGAGRLLDPRAALDDAAKAADPHKPSGSPAANAAAHADPTPKHPGPETAVVAPGAQPSPPTDRKPSGTSQTDTLLAAQSAGQSSTRTDIASAIRPMTAAYQAQIQHLNVPGIAFQMASQFRDGQSRFTIRLDPPEMGKIDVQMRMDNSGNLHAHLSVERADTLNLLQRDARGLERALAQAGINTGQTNLEFSLKQNPFAGQNGHSQGGQQHMPIFTEAGIDDDMPLTSAPGAIVYRGYASPGGINLLA